ncbi:MAG: hypothetical protein BWK76_17245 [Desulfobulbaceae bacterium A2]|nr:MAG: hypothetical protein BWK76_17245 [Desulfobulbaceae bacterium A2]
MMPTVLLQARELEVRRDGKLVVQVDDLVIHQGDFLALIGPNGAGKTTLLHVLASLLPPTRGQIFFKGEAVPPGPAGLAYRRQQAMVFQEPLLFATTVFDNVAVGLKLRGMAKGRLRELVAHNLERFGIAHLAQRSARKISGGEAQRTSLARALATEPEILFLDEPFSALDPLSREALIEDLDRVLHQSGITVVMTTHDHGEAQRLANRVAVMAAGRIRQLDSPTRVFRKPVDQFVAAFVGVDNRLPATVISSGDGRVQLEVAGVALEASGCCASGSAVTLCIRPESVRLLVNGAAGTTEWPNVVAARVVKVVRQSHVAKIYLDCGFTLTALTTDALGDEGGLGVGDALTVCLPPESLHIIDAQAPA